MAKNLLRLHLKKPSSEKQIDDIVEHLTQKLFSHQHFINRYEAKEIVGFGSIIENSKPEIEKLLNNVLKCYYYDELETKKIFNPEIILGKKETTNYVARRAIIESKNTCHIFKTELKIIKDKKSNQFNVNVIREGWQKE